MSNKTIVHKYPSGNFHCIASYKDGLLDGSYRLWYENGVLKRECNYKNGKLNGLMIVRFLDGRMMGRYSYMNGRLHGIVREWNDKGDVIYEKLFIDGYNHLREYDAYATLIRKKQIKLQELSWIDDIDVKRICLKEIGYEKLLGEIEYVVLDKVNKDELVVAEWEAYEELIYLVKVFCPSTNVFYVLRVPPYVKTVKEAIAWTFEMPENRYNPAQET